MDCPPAQSGRQTREVAFRGGLTVDIKGIFALSHLTQGAHAQGVFVLLNPPICRRKFSTFLHPFYNSPDWPGVLSSCGKSMTCALETPPYR